MYASNVPVKVTVPFATSAPGGNVRQVPTPTQQPANPNWASYAAGFPPDTFTPVGAGGLGPDGRDMNGLFQQITAWNQWQGAGGIVSYDPAFSAAVGGYPAGAFIASASLGPGYFWVSLVDNNTSDPDTGGANWSSFGPPGPAVPVGGLVALFDTTSVPAGCLPTNGAGVLRATYPLGFSTIGHKYATFASTAHSVAWTIGAGATTIKQILVSDGTRLHAIRTASTVSAFSIQDVYTTDPAFVTVTVGAALSFSGSIGTLAGDYIASAAFDGSVIVVVTSRGSVFNITTAGVATQATGTGYVLTNNDRSTAVAVGSVVVLAGEVGGAGGAVTIQLTSNHGATWTTPTLPTLAAGEAIGCATDGTNVVAITDAGQIISSASPFTTWTLSGTVLTIAGGPANSAYYVNGAFWLFGGAASFLTGGPAVWTTVTAPSVVASPSDSAGAVGLIYSGGVYCLGGTTTPDFQNYCAYPASPVIRQNPVSGLGQPILWSGLWVQANTTGLNVIAPTLNLATQFLLPLLSNPGTSPVLAVHTNAVNSATTVIDAPYSYIRMI